MRCTEGCSLHEEGCEGWTIMDFSDQLCFRKLLTVLHRFLKTLFIMKSTKTIFAISSIRCIKPLNSSSSCSPEQVYFSKKKKRKKKKKKKQKWKIFIKCYDAKKEKKEKKKKEQKKKRKPIFWVCTKTMKTYPSAWPDFCGFCWFCVEFVFFPSCMKWAFWSLNSLTSPMVVCACSASVANLQCWCQCLFS